MNTNLLIHKEDEWFKPPLLKCSEICNWERLFLWKILAQSRRRRERLASATLNFNCRLFEKPVGNAFKPVKVIIIRWNLCNCWEHQSTTTTTAVSYFYRYPVIDDDYNALQWTFYNLLPYLVPYCYFTMEKHFLVFLPFFWVKFLYDHHKAAAWESSNHGYDWNNRSTAFLQKYSW